MTRMIPISLHISKQWKELLDQLVKQGLYRSKAEAVRDAIRRMLLQYGVKLEEEQRDEREQKRGRPPLRRRRIEELDRVCREEPWVCYSAKLMTARGFGDAVVSDYIREKGLKYVYGFREDFYRILARDAAAMVYYKCTVHTRYISARPTELVVKALGGPNNYVAQVMSTAISLYLPQTRFQLHRGARYLFYCEDLKRHACNAEGSTIRYVYYAAHKRLEDAKAMYERFKHCIK